MISDLKLAIRSLLRSPGYTSAVIGTLALGIGACAALYSVLVGALQPLTLPELSRLVRIESKSKDQTFGIPLFAARIIAYREKAKSFEAFAAVTSDNMNLVVDGEPEGVVVLKVPANYFSLLGVTPALGRNFRPNEDQPGADNVLVITHRMWKARFGGEPNIIGKQVQLNDRLCQVIGVLPETYRDPPTVLGRIYVPFLLPTTTTPQGAVASYTSFAKLKPGIDHLQAQSELRTILPEKGEIYSEFMGRYEAVVLPIDTQPEFTGVQRFQAMQRLAFGAVGFLYLIACANAGSLMLVRALSRRRDVGVRMALGAGRWAVARPLFAESLILTGLAITLGGLVAKWLMPALLAIAPGGADSAYRALELDGETLAFLAGLGLCTGLLVASGPVWRTARLNLNDMMKDIAPGGSDSRKIRTVRSGLVVVETTLAVALLAGTGLLIRNFQQLQDYQPGYETENRYTISLLLPREETMTTEFRIERFKQVVERLKQLPGVADASLTAPLNVTFSNQRKLKIAGREDGAEVQAQGTGMAPECLDLIGVPLRAGRPLSHLRPGDPASVVVSETFAKTYFAARSPIGELLEISARDRWEIIGVVGDVRSARIEAKPRYYFPYWQQRGLAFFNIVLRATGPLGPKFNAEVRRAVYEVEPKFAVNNIARLDQPLKSEISPERFVMAVLEVLGALALLLAVIGLYAVIAYNVIQRQTEFGIRLALGATPGSIRRLVIREGLGLVAAGVSLGLALSWASARTLESLLYQISGRDPLVFGFVGALMLAVAWPACWWPSRRAKQIDVVNLLRPH